MPIRLIVTQSLTMFACLSVNQVCKIYFGNMFVTNSNPTSNSTTRLGPKCAGIDSISNMHQLSTNCFYFQSKHRWLRMEISCYKSPSNSCMQSSMPLLLRARCPLRHCVHHHLLLMIINHQSHPICRRYQAS